MTDLRIPDLVRKGHTSTYSRYSVGEERGQLLFLARVKVGERQVGVALARSDVLDRPFSLGSLVVESVALMKSELTPTGSVYTKLWEVRLRG